MKKKHLWLKKIMAAALCAAMAAEPAVIYAEEFSDGFYSETEDWENQEDMNQIPEETNGITPDENQETQNIPEAFDTPDVTVPSEEIQPSEENRENENKNTKGELLDIDGFETGTGDTTIDEDGFFAEESGETDSFTDSDAEPLSGTCGEGVTWSLVDGVMTISGNGEMDNFVVVRDFYTGEIIEEQSHPQPWTGYEYKIKEVYVEDGVTSVGDRAFASCFYLTKAVIGDSVKKIGEYAFVNDKNLTDLTIGKSVETIEMDALYGIGITRLVLPESLKNLNSYSLIALWQLEEIEMPDNGTYKSIDGALYSDQGKTLVLYPCKREGEYTTPDGVEKIAGGAFSYTSLTKLVIGDSVTEMESDAVDFSDALESITFGKGIKEIPSGCCYADNALKEVIIPEGVESIGSTAFWCCRSLDNVTLPSTIKSVGKSFDSHTKVTSLNPEMIQIEDGSLIKGLWVKATATERYDFAFQVLDLINEERSENGLNPLVMDTSLLETAMQRGFENIIYWNHTRPSGADCFSANKLMMGENIAAGQENPKDVMISWMNSQGHRENILTARYKSVGVGCVEINGVFFWVQCFGEQISSEADSASYSNQENTRSIMVNKDGDYYAASFDVKKTDLTVGETTDIVKLWGWLDIGESGAVAESSDPEVCSVSNWKITANKEGTATITMYFPGYKEKAVSKTIVITKKQKPEDNTGNNNGNNSGNNSGNNNENNSGNNSGSNTGSDTVNNSGSNNENTTEELYTVTFDGNGGTASVRTITVEARAFMETLPTAARAKYTFTGWYTKKKGGSKVNASTQVTNSCTYYAHWKKVTVSKGKVSKLTNGKERKMTVKLKKISGASGYQIFYSTNSKFTGAKTKTTSKTSLIISGLKKNKTYYVKVRAYKKDSKGKKVYGSYSAVRKIKIKK